MLNSKIDYKVKGYKNKWCIIDSNEEYALLENDFWGDETCYLVVRLDEEVANLPYHKKDGTEVLLPTIMNVVGETYDDLETALLDLL